MSKRKRTLVICNLVAAAGFTVAGIGNMLHGKTWIGVMFLVCALLQCVSALANARNPQI
ncbi:MAG: hypothetical protein ACI32N_07205 [Bulleidia sp.]